LGPLLRFHLVAGYGLLAGRGIGSVVAGLTAPGAGSRPGPWATVAALAVAGGGVLAVATTSFLLNRQLTWPRHSTADSTELISSSISATARR
jgi:hypothetical protein